MHGGSSHSFWRTLHNNEQLIMLKCDNERPDPMFFSLWEISIKNKLGRVDFKVDLAVLRRNLLDNGFEEIAINSAHAIGVDALPNIHKDPFDRM